MSTSNLFEPLPPDLSFDQKWDYLKPKIEELYIEQGLTLRKVSERLKETYKFDANESQYKYRINKVWKYNKKNIPAAKKTAINKRVSSQVPGSSARIVKYKERVVDKRKLRRQARTDLKQNRPKTQHQGDRIYDCNLSAFAGKIFMTWNVPYIPSKAPLAGKGNHTSPLLLLGSTPSDVSINSPDSRQHEPTHGINSSYNSALQKKTSIDRAWLFLDGKLQSTVGSMTHEEQMKMSTWLYQLWFFSFKTSKFWGQGPRNWTATNLRFCRSEAANFPTPASQDSPAGMSPTLIQPTSPATDDVRDPMAVRPPSQLCKWSIHVEGVEYERMPDPPNDAEKSLDVDNPNTYQPWSPSEMSNASFPNTLRDALESNDFSSIRNEHLPVAVPEVLQKAVRQEEDLIHESIAFAIMSRNVEMLDDILHDENDKDIDVIIAIFKAIDAFHLAAAYLDGAKSCCRIMNSISTHAPLRKLYINSLGHTVLDALMITIIKSHTSCKPETVDGSLRGTQRFPAEEMDICGRWDADSDCVRALLLKGKHRIPFRWKHKFCHTSAQAVCDVITTIWGCDSALNINTKSGLFVRRCSHCGLKMQLSPLHTLILVMYHLSTHGCEREDLFGIVATMLCLLQHGADACIRSSLHIASLIQDDSSPHAGIDIDGCQHEDLDPLQFAKNILQQCRLVFPIETVFGWEIFIELLLHAQRSRKVFDVETSNEEDGPELCAACFHGLRGGFWQNPELGLLWAVLRAELATYRRVSVSDSWTSPYINLKAILIGLRTNTVPDIRLIRGNMIKPSCRCGAFIGDHSDDCVRPSVACNFYFSNMEDWSRSSFLEVPCREWWDGWPVDEEPSSAATSPSESYDMMEANGESSRISTHTYNAHQASDMPQTSEQAADTIDQPTEDQLLDEAEVSQPHPPQDMDIDDPVLYEATSPAFIMNLPGQEFLNPYDVDADMYGAG